MECSRLRIITGLKTFSSKLPSAPAILTAVSLPITCTATMVMASAWVGFTLPGMIDEPGSFSGRTSSPSPERGPEPSQRMSFAIFISEAASVACGAGCEHDGVVARERRELVGRAHERQARELGDPRGDLVGEPLGRVQARADRGAADRELVQTG